MISITYPLPNPTYQQLVEQTHTIVVMPPEWWKPIQYYEGMYEISNTGKVRTLKHGKYKVMGYVKNNIGYLRAELYKKGVRRRFMIHRLVAMAFLGKPKGYTLLEVNHKDGNKKNNNWWNVEWMTKSENNSHRHHVLGKNNLQVSQVVEETTSWLDTD